MMARVANTSGHKPWSMKRVVVAEAAVVGMHYDIKGGDLRLRHVEIGGFAYELSTPGHKPSPLCFNAMLKWILIAASVAAASPAAAANLDPLAFFTGRTQGEGMLKIIMKAPVTISVDSRGKADGKGGIVLEQIIREGSKPLRSRRWVLRPTSPTTLAGTLTDAKSPVRGSVSGRVLKLNYTREDGLHASHILTLRPDGRTMINRMTVKRLGLVVARVEEVIRKRD